MLWSDIGNPYPELRVVLPAAIDLLFVRSLPPQPEHRKLIGIAPPSTCKRSAEPRLPLQPRPRGTQNSDWPAPLAGRGTSRCFCDSRAHTRSGWSFCREQFLTLARRSSCLHSRVAAVRSFLASFSVSRTSRQSSQRTENRLLA